MSSSRRHKSARPWSRRDALAGLGAALVLPLLSACGAGGFSPLYGTTRSGERTQDLLAAIDIAPIPGRVGQRLRNELIFGTTGGGYAQAPKYRLEIAIRESLADQFVRESGEAEGQIYTLEASFRLLRLVDNGVALQGKATSRAAFDRFEPAFANLRAQYDAENRAASTVADNIKVRLAAFLSGNA